MKTFIDIFKATVLAALFATTIVACTDDIDYPKGQGPEGEAATVTLKINVAEAVKLSRATSDTYVKNLWVGIFNASSSSCTYSGFHTTETDVTNHDDFKELKDINCKSGNSYIVAVANYDGYTATDMRDKTSGSLEDKLKNVKNWDDYCALAIEQNMAAGGVDISVAEPSNELIMSGSYYETSHSASVVPDQMEPVYIKPNTSTLSGAIHLRRLWAKNTLNISATGDIIDMELLDIEVFNVPKYSWIQDRSIAADVIEEIADDNAGDLMDSKAIDNTSYLSSMRFTPPAEISVSNGVYSFSYWQFENKRTGTSTSYEARDKEYKDGTNKNTGVYTSLCPTAEGNVNNNATYVKIRANITYKDPGNLVNPDGVEVGSGDNQLPPSAASRTAEVTYVVHLGYIDENTTDFNCHRNTNYIYNVTARSVGNILLEAFIEGREVQPGAEGTVTDVTDKIETLDAHSGVFNIFLTTEQVAGFTFSMRTYVSNQAKTFYYNSETDNNIPSSNDEDFKYYNWIEFVPTGYDVNRTDANKTAANERRFASFPNITTGRANAKVYYPHELPKSGLDGQWFTVYVNEYTYERPYGYEGTIYGTNVYGNESGTNWKSYVNQPNRQAWFNVAQEVSADGESVYFKSKYALTQRSLQTYYNMDEESCETALGVEHINENFGQNIRWSGNRGSSGDNGRSNMWEAISSNRTWSQYLNMDAQQSVNVINNTLQTANTDLDLSARTYPVVQQILLTGYSGSGSGHYNSGASAQYDPQNGSNAQFINAAYACLSRNKDENGNGTIDPEEVKWYLPAAGKYLRLILGRNSLSPPLMDYAQSKLYDKCGDDANTRYHFISSDAKIIWLDEGLSSSDFLNNGNWSHAPWQLRCIRNLGTDLRTGTTDGVTPAYDDTDYDGTTFGGVVKVKHYYGTALREPTTSALPMHKTSDSENKLGRYGFEIAPRGNFANATKDREAPAQFINASNHTITQAYGPSNMATYKEYSDSIAIASPCQDLNNNSGRKGWRVPNQKEIAIMMRMGVLGTRADDYSWVQQWYQWRLQASADGESTQDGFMTCTQEHWTNFNDNSGTLGSSTEELSWDYRMVTAEPVNKIATATNWKQKYIRAVRCVRDLTAAEANKSYDDIVNNR